MRAFLAVSAAPGRVPGATPRTLSYLDGHGEVTVRESDEGWLAYSGAEPDGDHENAGSFTFLLTRSVRGRTGDMPGKALGGMLGDGSRVDGAGLSSILPPFAVAHREGPGQPIVLCGDWLGMRQLFWWQGDGVAAVSTSALALAQLSGAALDPAHAAMQSLLGHQVGANTLFTGVNKLPAGSLALLHGGSVRVQRYTEPTMELADPRAPLSNVVDEMAGILREIHSAYLADHPGTVLQLTGGQDSRVLLCAIPAEARRGMAAMTLGVRGAPDVIIAAKLSALCGLDHRVHWLDQQPPIEAADAHRMAVDAAIALDCMASPLALAPLMLAEAGIDQGHRLSGAGGETARGFYYPGQPRQAVTSSALVNRLAEWRLFLNEAVETGALDPDFAHSARKHALEQLDGEFGAYSREWLRATDEFYLFNRVQRWAGAHGTPAATRRFFVNPMLDRRFVQLALATTPDEKRNAHLMGRLMSRLDARLASVPLDSGLVPDRLGRPGLGTTMAVARVTARKAARKVQQRLGRTGKAQLGAEELAKLVVTHWRANPGTVESLPGTGLVNPVWLGELLDAKRDAPAATVTFLLNLLVASDVSRRETTEVGS